MNEPLLPFDQLQSATLVQRYKRFFADATLADGQAITAHCANTGSMRTCGSPGDKILVSPSNNPKRKLKYTWELTKTDSGFICVNTQLPNRIVEAAVTQQLVPELSGYGQILREQKYGSSSKIDLLLQDHPEVEDAYVEIKSVTLFDDHGLSFPDAVTSRGQKHLRELMEVANQGQRAVLFFLVGRPEGSVFSPAWHIDATYAELLSQAADAGVEVLCYRADIDLDGIRLGPSLPIALNKPH